MSYKIHWDQEQVIAKINSDIEKNMAVAMEFAAGESRRLISKGAGRRKRSRITGRLYSREPAAPAPTPPRVVTGQLRSSLKSAVKRAGLATIGAFGVRRGVAEKYGLILELGTTKHPKRPYLRRTLEEKQREIFHLILGNKLK